MKKKLYLVVEGSIIWAAFPKSEMATAFKRREFGTSKSGDVRIIRLPIYQTLEEAPTTKGRRWAAWASGDPGPTRP
jgi:hypothetical protein